MTERLALLLREGADTIDVPPMPDGLVPHARTVRRRRRIGTGIATVATIAVVTVTTGYAVTRIGDESRAVEPAGPSTGHGAVFTLGTTVFWDGGTKSAQIDDKAIKSTYYTSAGLLVRHGNNNFSDGGGPQRFSLVTEDGTVTSVSVVTEEVVPGIDPTQPYLAYAVVTEGTVEVVVHDVSTDEEVARVPVPDAKRWGGWSAPPVSLSGDTVYVGTDDVIRAVDWRTGEVDTVDTLEPGFLDISGGRAVEIDNEQMNVVDVGTGEVLLTMPRNDMGYLQLSPDGRYAVLDAGKGAVDVYDVGAGTKVTVDGNAFGYGWSPDGDLFKVVERHVVTCDSTTGECATGELTIPREGGGVAPDDLRYGNQTYES